MIAYTTTNDKTCFEIVKYNWKTFSLDFRLFEFKCNNSCVGFFFSVCVKHFCICRLALWSFWCSWLWISYKSMWCVSQWVYIWDQWKNVNISDVTTNKTLRNKIPPLFFEGNALTPALGKQQSTWSMVPISQLGQRVQSQPTYTSKEIVQGETGDREAQRVPGGEVVCLLV